MATAALLLLMETVVLASGPLPWVVGEEFPIAATADDEFGLALAFDGTSYLVGFNSDQPSNASITALMLAQTGLPISPRISVGRSGGTPSVAFDGTNYLLVWEDDETRPSADVYAQFVNTAGMLVGPAFPVSTAPGRQDAMPICVAFGRTTYLVVWSDYRYTPGSQGPSTVYGQFVSTDGLLLGREIKISTETGRRPSVAFDGTNFLVAWVEDDQKTDYYGQFIAEAGEPIGENFLIDATNSISEYFTVMLFDGARYVLTVEDEIGPGQKGYYARLIDTNGRVSDERIPFYEGPAISAAYLCAFDGQNYLAVLSESMLTAPAKAKAAFFSATFEPLGDWFTLFETRDGKIPIAPFAIFDGNKYLVVATRIHASPPDELWRGDVYGLFLHPAGSPCSEDLPADLNGDCYVNWADIAIFASQWLECRNPSDPACE